MTGSEWMPFFQGATASILVGAGVAKLSTRTSIEPFLMASGIRPAPARLIARGLPPFEVLLGVGMLIPFLGAATAWTALALAVTFVVVQARTAAHGAFANCRCFGLDDDGPRFLPLVRALWFAVCGLGLVIARSMSGDEAVESGVAATTALIGTATSIAAIAATFLVARVVDFETRRPRAMTPTPVAASSLGEDAG